MPSPAQYGIAPKRRGVVAALHVEGQLVRHDGIGIGVVIHCLQNRGEGIDLAPCRHAGVLEQLGHARARTAQAGEVDHLHHIGAAEAIHSFLPHRAQCIAAVSGETVGVVRTHAGTNSFRGFDVVKRLLLLRFRRVIGGVCRLQRLGFQSFLRGALIAVAACAGAPMGRQNADDHQRSHRRSDRRHQRTPANRPAASAGRHTRMTARARSRARMTPLRHLPLVEMSVDRFSHHVLPRIARTQKRGSRSFRNMIPTAA